MTKPMFKVFVDVVFVMVAWFVLAFAALAPLAMFGWKNGLLVSILLVSVLRIGSMMGRLMVLMNAAVVMLDSMAQKKAPTSPIIAPRARM